MNEMYVEIDFKKNKCLISGAMPKQGDYSLTKIVFNFDDDYEGRKVVEIRKEFSQNADALFSSEIINNQVVLEKVVEGQNYPVFRSAGPYYLEVSLYGNGGKLSSVFQTFQVLEDAINVSDEETEPYLPVFDQLIAEIDEKIAEVDHVDVDVTESGNTTTITTTNRHNVTKTAEVYDGTDGVGLEYNWDGTSLGIKREDEQNYQYVDLEGSCNFATFEINLTTGNLEMNKTDDMLLEFGIEDSMLYVEI